VLSQFLAAAATVGLLGAGLANSAETRSFEAMTGQIAMFGNGEGGGADNKCRVDVVRSGAAGTADIVRQTFNDGSCVCTITTGPEGNNGSAEEIVTNLLRDRECASTPAIGEDAAQAAGGPGTIIGVLAAVAGAGGGVAVGGNDSAG
jgi:hypothetical protein